MKRFLATILTALLVSPLAHAVADSNANSMSDAWERRFNQGQLLSPSFLPAGDADGDGVSNLNECLAGTDPFNGTPPLGLLQAKVRHVSAVYTTPQGGGALVLVSPEAYIISWPAEYGKLYSLHCSPDLSPQSWLAVGGLEYGYGEEIEIATLPTYQDGTVADKFFWRVAVTDTDSDGDGDGFTDHDEYLKGTDIRVADRDDDGLPDDWEILHSLDPDDDGTIEPDKGPDGDLDADGLSNIDEYWYGTHPRNADTDSDHLTDFEEPYFTYTDPTKSDTDGDGIPDGPEDPDHDGLTNLAELRFHHTLARNADTDGDTLHDGWELDNNLDPLVYNSITDPDEDGLTNAQEQYLGTAPLIADTDNDQILDGAEDPDGDGLSNLAELNTHHTDPLRADSDGDELTDPAEINTHLTNPRRYDTDGDTLPDGFEVLSTHLDPLIDNDPAVDFEPDGMSDQYEAIYGFNPDVNDSSTDPDGDGLTTAEEVVFQSDPTDADIDSDGLNDFQENNNLPNPTDPWKWDTDGDRLPGKWEIDHGLNPVLSDNTYLDDDSDGLSLEQEYRNGTDPAQGDSDGDGALDGAEVAANTSPTDGDWGGIPPSAASNIQTNTNPDGTTTFTWNDHSNNERGFRLRVKPPDGVWILLGDVPAGTTTFATTGPQELSADGPSVEVESYNPFGGSFAANGAPGPNGEHAPGSGTPAAPEPPPETYKASFEIRSDGKEVANSCARCHNLEVQVDGRKYADSAEITLTKKKAYDITVVDTPRGRPGKRSRSTTR